MPFISEHKEPDGAWRFFMNTLVPIVLIPVPVALTFFYPEYKKDHHLLYVFLLLGIFWASGSLAFVITALIPLVLFPLLGIQFAGKVAANFCQEQVALLIGQFILGGSLAATNLPQYLSARFYLYTSNRMDRIILVLFLGSLVTSMIFSSTIGAVLMCQVVLAMLEDRIRDTEEDPYMKSIVMRESAAQVSPLAKLPSIEAAPAASENAETDEEEKVVDPFYNNFLTELKRRYLIVVYAGCNVGGLLFTFGSPPTNFFYSCGRNKMFEIAGKKNFSTLVLLSDAAPVSVTQISWILFIAPLLIVLALTSLFYWILLFTKMCPLIKSHGQSTIFKRTITNDGPLKPAYAAQFIEIKANLYEGRRARVVLSFLLICSVLMLLRDPRTLFGWIQLIPKKADGTETLAEDSAVAFLLIIILCGFPAFQGSTIEERSEPILRWGPTSKFVMWNVIFLFSGQNMLAEGANVTNVTKATSDWINGNGMIRIGILLLMVLFMTSVWGGLTTSVFVNTVMTRVSQTNPIYGSLAFPLTALMSLNFISPVATPPNAITTIASFYDVRARHMIKYGFPLQIIVLLILYGYQFGYSALRFHDFP